MAASTDPYSQVTDDDYIKVSETENDEFIEIPKEDNDSIMLSTIQTQFPDAIGLKFRGSSGAWRAIRAVDNIFEPPKGGWGDKAYCVSNSKEPDMKKRKSESYSGSPERKRPTSSPYLKDMFVMGLPYSVTTDELKEYFEKNYGETAYCEVKYDRSTNKSRGFGFVRFSDAESAREVSEADHFMEGRKVTVKVKQEKPIKMFVGRLPNDVKKEDIEEYFSKYGELKDVYIPQPFRNFAFITYANSEDGFRVLRDSHVLDGARLNVEERKPDMRGDPDRNQDRDRDQYRDRHRDSHRGRDERASRDNHHSKYGEERKDVADNLKSMLFNFITQSR